MGTDDLDPLLLIDVLGEPQAYPIAVALLAHCKAVLDPGCPLWALARY